MPIKNHQQELETIRELKKQIRKQMNECYNMQQLFELDNEYHILEEKEEKILKRCKL